MTEHTCPTCHLRMVAEECDTCGESGWVPSEKGWVICPACQGETVRWVCVECEGGGAG